MFTELDPSIEYIIIPISENSTYYYRKKDEYTLKDKCLVIDKTSYTESRFFYKDGILVLKEKQENKLFTRTLFEQNKKPINYLYRKDSNNDFQLVKIFDDSKVFEYGINTGFLTKTTLCSGSIETEIRYIDGIVSYVDISDNRNGIFKTFSFNNNKLNLYEYKEVVGDEIIRVEYTSHNNNLYVELLDDYGNAKCSATHEDGFFKTKDELIFFIFANNLPRDIEYHHLMIDSNDKLYFGDLYHEI